MALALVLATLGTLLVTDKPGFRTEYFGLGEPWEGRPVYTTVSQPRLESAEQAREVLASEFLFSIRWNGWWHATEGGEHLFALDADNGGYIRIDGDYVVDRRTRLRESPGTGRKDLEPGLHAVEIGLFQREGRSHLEVRWAPPGTSPDAASALPAARLYGQRPVAPRRVVRRALASWPRPYRQLLGAALLLAVVLMLPNLTAPLSAPAARLRAWIGRINRTGLRAAFLLALFVVVFLGSLPFTGTVRGGDDTAYLAVATFGEKAWFFNRYAHVYLLKAFVTLSGGDPFVGVRLWWSFAFAVTVASLAVAVRSVGPGLQLRTLTATLFVLMAQAAVLGMIGAGFADYSAMMFITAAVAVYMHGIARASDLPPPRYEWHALAVGALTLGAMRSKEVGAILLLLPLFFLIEDGRIDLRRFARRMAFWAAGAAGVLLLLVLLDGWILGEFLFTFNDRRFGQAATMNFPDGVRPREDHSSWWRVVWLSSGHPGTLALRNLWVGVVVAAIAAGLRRCRVEIRLLHLLPIAFLLALMALYIRMPHPFSGRMLIPILPVACLMTGLLLYHAGLEDVEWRQLLAPRVLIPAGLATAVICLIVVPYRMGALEGADFLPVELLSRYGWKPDLFLIGTLFPATVLVVLSALAFFVANRPARIVALLVGYLVFFGLGFEFNRVILAQRRAAQRGEQLLYPWRVFSDELEAAHPSSIVLSKDVHGRYKMSAATRSTLAGLALGRRDVFVELSRELPTEADIAIASRFIYDRWRKQLPALEATARSDPAGLLVLVRPKEAIQGAADAAERQ